MNWTLPGTTITARREDADQTRKQFDALFLAGGLALSQVAAITGLEPYTIQNWVKRGFLSPPQGKRYTKDQVCRIITINMLKGTLTLEQACGLMSYVNGDLADTSDDLINDADLYFMFVRLAARSREHHRPESWDAVLDEELASYEEPAPGAKDRVRQVLRVMLTAWIAARMTQEAEQMLSLLKAN